MLNFIVNLISSENISNDDIILAISGIFIVFAALFLLYLIFFSLPKVLNFFQNRNRCKENDGNCKDSEVEITGETNAAISMALYMFFNEQHDEESNIITIKKISKIYSPWSSKIYGLNNFKK